MMFEKKKSGFAKATPDKNENQCDCVEDCNCKDGDCSCESDDCNCNEGECVCENCAKLEQKVGELTGQLQRALADYQNLQKRTAKEREDIRFITNLGIIGKLIEVSDDFDSAISKYTKTEADEAEWLTGIKLVKDKMVNILKDQEVAEIVCQSGDVFDPHFHEALSTMKVTDKEMDGKIAGIISKGYMLGDKVLKATKVMVGKYE